MKLRDDVTMKNLLIAVAAGGRFLERNDNDRINARTVLSAGIGGVPGETLDAGSSQLDRNNSDN